MQDTVSTIFKSARQFFSGTLFSRVTGLLRDIATAYAFGVSPSVAAFMVAFRFSHLLRRILGEGALQGAFTPNFEQLRLQNPKEAAQFFSTLNTALTVVLCLVTALFFFLFEGIYSSSHLSEGNAEIIHLTGLLIPGLLFICLYGLNAALLQCQKQYFLPSAAPAILNIGWTIGVFCLSSLPPATAMPWLALCVVLSTALQWLATVPACYKTLKILDPQARWMRWDFRSTALRKLLTPLALSSIGIAASQINSALDGVFARYAELEGPAYLWYAIRIQQLPLALFGIAIANALLPPLARAAKSGDFKLFHHFLGTAWKGTLALMVPITLFIFLFGQQMLQLVYGHGQFNEEAAKMTQQCLEGYTLGLIPMALIICHVQGYYAQGNYRTPMIASLASIAVNCGLNWVLIMGMGWGSASIAAATGVSAWIQLGILKSNAFLGSSIAGLIQRKDAKAQRE